MDTIKRFLFWIVLAAVVLLSLGFYFLWVTDLKAQKEDLNAQIVSSLGKVQKVANASKNIRNENYVKAVVDYRSHLETQMEQIIKLWEDKGLSLSDKFNSASGKSPLAFDTWLDDLRKEIQEMAKAQNLQLPSDFEVAHLYKDKTTTPDTINPRLQSVQLVYEVVRILCETKVDQNRYPFNPNVASPEQVQRVPVGAVRLDHLAFIESSIYRDRQAELYAASFKDIGAPPSQANPSQQVPVAARGLALTFTAPFAAVPKIVQALETSPRWFGIVRLVDTQRVSSAYPEEGNLDRLAPNESNAKGLDYQIFNTHEHEGMAQARVILDLVQFDKDKAKKELEEAKELGKAAPKGATKKGAKTPAGKKPAPKK